MKEPVSLGNVRSTGSLEVLEIECSHIPAMGVLPFSQIQPCSRVETNRETALGFNTEQPFIDFDNLPTFGSEEERQEFNRVEARAFFEEFENKGWKGTPENVSVLMQYFTNRGIETISRAMWKAAFLSLRRDGLFEEKPIPAPAVASEPIAAPVTQEEDFSNLPRLPINQAYRAPGMWYHQEQGQMGRDPLTGAERFYSAQEISDMPGDMYKRVFRIPTTQLTRANFGR